MIIYRDHHQESREIKRGRVQPCAREIVTEETFFYRSCIGQRFARLELYIMMTKVVQRFKLEYDGEPVGSITRWVGGLVGWGWDLYLKPFSLITRLVSIPDRPVNLKFTPRG